MRGSERFAIYRGEYLRTWRGRLVSLLLLVPGMWLSVLLIRVPAGHALTVPALLIDRVVAASTAVVFPLAVLLLLMLPTRGARAAAVAGGAVSAIVGLPTFLAALEPPRVPFPTGLALVSVICGLIVMGMLLRPSLKGRRWSLSFLAPLSLLPAIQFWQATTYTPAQLVTSVTPAIGVTVQRMDGEERRGVIEVETANHGAVRATIFSADLVYCFVTEDMREVADQSVDDLRADENCDVEGVYAARSEIDAQATHGWSMNWAAPVDRPLIILAVESWYVREDRFQLEGGSPHKQESAAGCQGPVTTHRLQPDTRFKGLVQPTRLLTYDDISFYFSYEGSSLCNSEHDNQIVQRMGVRFIEIRESEWLTDGA